jgi:hypothetical protein
MRTSTVSCILEEIQDLADSLFRKPVLRIDLVINALDECLDKDDETLLGLLMDLKGLYQV